MDFNLSAKKLYQQVTTSGISFTMTSADVSFPPIMPLSATLWLRST